MNRFELQRGTRSDPSNEKQAACVFHREGKCSKAVEEHSIIRSGGGGHECSIAGSAAANPISVSGENQPGVLFASAVRHWPNPASPEEVLELGGISSIRSVQLRFTVQATSLMAAQCLLSDLE